jgi:hypothetical protein
MPKDVIEALHEYARFLESSLDHVVIGALKLVFKKDGEFKAWRSQQNRLREVSSAADCANAAPTLQFPNSKRDGHRATGERERAVVGRITRTDSGTADRQP